MHLKTNQDLPRVSIIVPCYKQAQYLDECLNSVLYQTIEEWECIIVNDGSPDNTIEVTNEWVRRDPRFRIITLPNGGVSRARNVGVQNAKAELILPLDGDDKIHHQYLEKALSKFSEGISLVYCKAEFFGAREGAMGASFTNYSDLLLKNQIFVSAVFRKKDCESIGGFDEKLTMGYEDWEFFIRLLDKVQGNVVQLDFVGFYYRIKTVSRNQNIMADSQLRDQAYNMIFKKHFSLYYKHFGSPLRNLKQLHKLRSKHSNPINYNNLSFKLVIKHKLSSYSHKLFSYFKLP
ncbi:hypothetical protein BST97_00090 [Nonlabens spongiae]|uniref:Uncharacterized protein n=2 Tax=Nonlabens spongiae TaxID=331648 RepID=A0A1W6MFZ6_9FLAO|nr:hypothetical protein BST97_00090 [Nonlabens spongiae]